MGEIFQNLIKRVQELNSRLTNTQRLIGGSVIFVLVMVVALLVFVNSQTRYVVLQRGITVEKAGEISAKLDELSIKWKAEDNSTTILVDEKNIDKARMDLTVSGITDGEGFSWEDVIGNMSITMTSEEKNRMFLLAQQTSLEKHIKTLNGIDKVTVRLFVADQSAFLSDGADVAKASVILTLRSGYALNNDQVNGIVMLITNAVEGLVPEKVTITDQTGKQLNRIEDDSSVSASTRQEEVRIQIEERMNRNLNDFLATIYGEDNVRVQTHVTLDFDRQSSESIVFAPPIEGSTEGLVRSMTELKENVVNADNGGAPGTDSNTDTTTYAELDGGSSNYQKANQTLNYELNQVKTVIEKAEGQVETLSIAVIINKIALVDSILTDEHKAEIIRLVTGASGIADPKLIQVSAFDFSKPELIPVTPVVSGILGIPYWLLGVMLGLMILVSVVTYIVFSRKKKSSLADAQAMIAEREALEEINTDFQDKSSPKYQIEKFIEAKPEAVAQLLRSWLRED